MKSVRMIVMTCVVLATAVVSPALAQTSVGTAISYSRTGMKFGGVPLTGTYDVQFTLYDASTGGNQIGPTLAKNNRSIVNGSLSTVTLDFGDDAFDGDARWIEVSVRQGANSFAIVGSRQRFRAVPYALALPGMRTVPNNFSPNVIGGYSGNIVSEGVIGATIGGGGLPDQANSISANLGSIGGGGTNLVAGPAATIGGGELNSANTNYATVGGGEDNTVNGSHSTIGGGLGNLADSFSSTIGGGELNSAYSTYNTVGGGFDNTVNGAGSTIGGGVFNLADGNTSTIGGGIDNTTFGPNATVAGGSGNFANENGASIGGGGNNAARAYSTVAGGEFNVADGSRASIGGGASNTASGQKSTVSGGLNNVASGDYSFVGAGLNNSASGNNSIVCGGDSNSASGHFSFAAGRRAKAGFDGSFVWADSTDADFFAGGVNGFNVRASGGTRIFSNSALTTGVFLSPGGGAWASASDRSTNCAAPFQTRK